MMYGTEGVICLRASLLFDAACLPVVTAGWNSFNIIIVT